MITYYVIWIRKKTLADRWIVLTDRFNDQQIFLLQEDAETYILEIETDSGYSDWMFHIAKVILPA